MHLDVVTRALLALLLFAASLPAAANDYLRELIGQARAQRLAERPEWQALLHYRTNLLFPGVTGQADDTQFYRAPDGKTNPQAELEATLAAFFIDTAETEKTQPPQCAFIARYQWLKQELHFDPARLPEQTCRRYHEWRQAINAASLTLVFPAAYINNPSSMFGHTLLRVDAADQDERTRLLAYAINYAVNPNGEGGSTFIFKSLIGAYPGAFSLMPYYIKVKEYSELENRDIWEYELTFTPEEIDRLLMHAWELDPVRFDYFFFDENCAYHLLSLFEVARPGLALRERFRGWVIPSDTLRAMAAEPGLIKNVVYRPASTTRLRHRLAALSAEERVLTRALANQEIDTSDEGLQRLPSDRRAAALEAAYEYVRYEYAKGRRDRGDAAQQSRALLLARSALDVPAQLGDIPTPAVHPDRGHDTVRLALGAGEKDTRRYTELKLRPAYHDLLDHDGGYTEGAQINFLDFTLRYYDQTDDLVLENFSAIEIVSLYPRDAFFQPRSWKINTGVARKRVSETHETTVFRTNGGAGVAFQPWRSLLWYGFVDATIDAGGALEDGYALGLGPNLGVLALPSGNWKINAYVRALEYGLGHEGHERELTVAQSLALGRNSALRLNLSRKREADHTWTDGNLSWHLYF